MATLWKRLVVVTALALLLAPLAVADVVKTRDGRTIEGEIVEETSAQLKIKTRFGTVTVARSKVLSIEKKATPRQELETREKSVDRADADALFVLATFAREHRLRKDAERLTRAALEVDPDHGGANRALGRVRHGGRWMTPEEREQALVAEREAAMRERGLVQYQGRWVTVEEAEKLRQGLILQDGQWMTETAARRAQGYHRVDGEWVHETEAQALERVRQFAADQGLDLAETRSDHFVLATSFGQEYSDGLAVHCEAGLKILRELLHRPAGVEWLGGSKITVLVLEDRRIFGEFARFFARHEPKVDQRWAEGVARSDGFYWWDPVGTTATFKGGRILEQVTGRVIHQLGHVLLNRYQYNFKFLPTWLDEGAAALLERDVLHSNMTSCLATRRYGSDGRDRDRELLPGGAWVEEMERRILEGSDPPFRGVVRRDFSTLEPGDVTKAMVVLSWMRDTEHEWVQRLLTRYREVWPAGRPNPTGHEAMNAHTVSLQEIGLTIDGVDAQVREFLQGRE